MWDLLGQIVASNFATVLSVCCLILGAGYYYWKIIPMMEECEQIKQRNAELEANPRTSTNTAMYEAELAEVVKALKTFTESTQIDSLDMKEGLNSVLRAVQRFERINTQQSIDHQTSVDLMREVLDGINGQKHELEKLSLRLQSISSLLYTTPNAPGNSESNDLRALR